MVCPSAAARVARSRKIYRADGLLSRASRRVPSDRARYSGVSMLNGHGVIDADSHIHDFHLDWPSLLPPELHDTAPRTFYEPSGFPHIEVEGRLLPGGEHDLAELTEASTRDPKYWG